MSHRALGLPLTLDHDLFHEKISKKLAIEYKERERERKKRTIKAR